MAYWNADPQMFCWNIGSEAENERLREELERLRPGATLEDVMLSGLCKVEVVSIAHRVPFLFAARMKHAAEWYEISNYGTECRMVQEYKDGTVCYSKWGDISKLIH